MCSLGCDSSRTNIYGQTPLHLAASKGHRACLGVLLKKGCDPMDMDLMENTPLHNAVVGSHYDSVRELLNNDEVDVNQANSAGETPLHCASSAGIVGLLLANGADPTLRQLDNKLSSFESFLERMPEGCNIILNSFLKSNGKSPGAVDFEITMNFALFLKAQEDSTGRNNIDLIHLNLLPKSWKFLHMFRLKHLINKHINLNIQCPNFLIFRSQRNDVIDGNCEQR